MEIKMTLITSILAVVIAVDHALAATDAVKANSTGQLIVNAIGAALSAVMDVIGKV